jgi:mannose-6-phosphate isomerase-like protein (cupin superfamily)
MWNAQNELSTVSFSPAQLEVVRHALSGVAEEMGVALRRAAYSPNIKERADCSAAVFDPDGEMVAQAEHIPVHLGSMPASVAAVLDAFGGRLEPGQQAAVNDPYAGGTHLPDLTVVAPVYERRRLLGYVANRAHHADVGGAAPGAGAAAGGNGRANGAAFFPDAKVKEKFKTGGLLLDTESYKIDAGRREQPGDPELHEREVDVIRVTSGSAKGVTGGTIRGDRIEGGRTQELHEGDVLAIPSGVPHQFVEVSDPFLYFVVKVEE